MHTCMHIPARFLQDPTKCKRKGPFVARMYNPCKILLQNRFYCLGVWDGRSLPITWSIDILTVIMHMH